MKKIYLLVTLFAAVLLLENCRKDTVTATATSSSLLFADINDSIWNPTTIRASMFYNLTNNSKTLFINGSTSSQQITIGVTLTPSINTAGFPITTYNVNNAGSVSMLYSILSNGTFVQPGTVGAGSGTIAVTAIDSVKKLITGTFSFTTVKTNYDNNGVIVSTQVNQITQGAFNKLPYTFTAASN